MKSKWNLDHLIHGGDYNPEQWLDRPDILEKDIEYLKKANCNAVTLGVFSWAVLEPREGEFAFEWMEQIIENLYKNGISTILATPSGARPKWLSDKYPEVLRVDESRHRNLFGARHNHCYTSPIYRDKVKKINSELAGRFANHPGVILWHLSNEYGGECHCELCQEAFRDWLREKYQTIEEVNKRWSTTFWSHCYQDFSQIESPSPRGEKALHGLNLDWKRFVTHQTAEFAKFEAETVRPYNEQMPITINMMYYYDGLNYFKFKDLVDIISWDTYPCWHKRKDSQVAMDTGMFHDIMRSIKNQPFLLMESTPSATNWQGVSKLKKPGMHELSSLQAIAHGSNSVQYFQWRQSIGASEKFHGAVVEHYGGCDTRVFQDVKNLGKRLEDLHVIAKTNMESEVAVIYDWENKWALEDAEGPRNDGMHYKETVQKHYSGLRRLGLNVDVIDMECDISKYRILAAPLAYMFREQFELRIRKFVQDGGILIMGCFSGIVDETDRCFLEGTPHGLLDVLGMRSAEIDGLYDWEENHMKSCANDWLNPEKLYICKNLCEIIKVSSAKVLMKYTEDFYKDSPAFTVNQFGQGEAYYIGTDAEQEFFDDIYRRIVMQAELQNPGKEDIPDGVEVTVRTYGDKTYTFIQNFNPWEVSYRGRLGKYETLVY